MRIGIAYGEHLKRECVCIYIYNVDHFLRAGIYIEYI